MKVVIDARSSLLGGGLTFAYDLYWCFFFNPECDSVYLLLESGVQADPEINLLKSRSRGSKFWLRNFVKNQKIDAVIFSGTFNFSYIPKSVWYCHNNVPFSKIARATFNPIERAVFSIIRIKAFVTALNVDTLAFTSFDSKNLYIEEISVPLINFFRCLLGRNRIQIEVIHTKLSGIVRRFGDFPRWKPTPNRQRLEFVMVSSWRRYKRIDLFVEFLGFFLEKNVDFDLFIHFVGSFKDEIYCKEVFNRLDGLPSLQYSCREDIHKEEVVKLLLETDGFLFCSTTEAGSLALLEALHVGIPCFVERSTSTPEYLGNYPHYFDLKSYEEFESQFSQFLGWVHSLKVLSKEQLLVHEELRERQIAVLGNF